jgi:dephospho-CoA kinase
MKNPVIGLIGGMGSGKSLVAAQMARHGGRIISGDLLGHEALGQPKIRERLIEYWGSEILDANGIIDRRKVAALVFADADQRRKLERVVHPWIGRRIEEEIARARADDSVPFIVVDAAIMLETGWNKVCDRLVYVDASGEARLRRLGEQRQWTAEEVEAREQAQMPLCEKRKFADEVVDNSGTPEQLAQQVDRLLERWKQTLDL